ncbi:MAG: MarR family transcriptional regulator [Balneolaceae bacterium]|nr:MarR family transcriptional regulator [Balneolaceae bacterium]
MKKEIGVYIDRTYKVVRQDLINRFKKAGINITPEQWVILSKLNGSTLSQADLASESFKDKHTVSRIIDLLQKKGFVTRSQDPDDGRRYLVQLTENGKSETKRAQEHVYASRELGWENINEDEYTQLRTLLDKVFNSYSKG